ncbi:MAG: YggT family protein [Clostridia bacterium]|nr:YggT family protein [Clostridia bacterium]
MHVVIYVVMQTVIVFLEVLQFAMLIRAIISWLPIGEGKFADFLYAFTEPVIIPIRMLFDKMGWFQNSPLDISFMVTYLLLSFISVFLAVLF